MIYACVRRYESRIFFGSVIINGYRNSADDVDAKVKKINLYQYQSFQISSTPNLGYVHSSKPLITQFIIPPTGHSSSS